MWNTKFMAWIERKLIDLTSSVYLKRRETPAALVEDTPRVAPTLQRAPVEPKLTKKRTFVKRNEAPKKATPKAKAKPAAIKAKAPTKKAAPAKAKAKPAAKAVKPAAKPKSKK